MMGSSTARDASLARNFHHPFTPYDIQLEFMNSVYECIQDKQIGIFESPTGTGKSLSLICGSLTWLRDHELEEVEAIAHEDYDGEPEWIISEARKERIEALLSTKKEMETHLARVKAREAKLKARYEHGEPPRKRTKIEANLQQKSTEDEEARFALDDYESDSETKNFGANSNPDENSGLSSATLELMKKLGMTTQLSPEETLDYPDRTKIFYCSRTHSQLIQFAHEVRRVDMSSGIPCQEVDEVEPIIERIKHLPLGSRKNLCVNPEVNKLKSSTAINERCLELQQTKVSKGGRCSLLPTKENEPLVHNFRDHVLAKIHDIEDMADLGKKIGICPYYSSRAVVGPSEIVTVPYPLMLQKTAREALGLSLKDHVVIIDEAHNILDAISNIYSSTVSLGQLTRARAQLGIYLQKFRNKLKGKNRVYVTQVVRLIDSIADFLKKDSLFARGAEGIANVADLMAGKGADQINLNKLAHYLRESKLARKVDGYAIYQHEAEQQQKSSTPTQPALTHIEGFLMTLNNPAKEGRFFYLKSEHDDPCLKYQLLDPTYHFKDVVEEARAVVLAGGTMSPMDGYVQHLFPYVEPGRIRMLSCGHVIPKENLLAWPVSHAKGGIELDFTYAKRNQPQLLDALGTTILDLATVIPRGLVVFFPSYAYLDQTVLRWKQDKQSTWDRINQIKPVFAESKQQTSVDDMLKGYSEAITSGGGALLLSVVGGKLSEGINFSDDLGRGVVIVGLPFPNIQSAEWKAKMEHIEQQVVAKGGSSADGRNASRNFYENACMRAVNQSIGRAIRHKGDYATIVMLDKRYNTDRIKDKLPGWIKKGLVERASTKRFEEVVSSTKRFFDTK